jgi:hypothetical protein
VDDEPAVVGVDLEDVLAGVDVGVQGGGVAAQIVPAPGLGGSGS